MEALQVLEMVIDHAKKDEGLESIMKTALHSIFYESGTFSNEQGSEH